MSSEYDCRAAILVALQAGRAPKEIIDFLKLPWEDACLAFHLQEGAVSTASAVQVREPAHTRSIGRWRRYRRQLQPMCDELAAAGVALDGAVQKSRNPRPA